MVEWKQEILRLEVAPNPAATPTDAIRPRLLPFAAAVSATRQQGFRWNQLRRWPPPPDSKRGSAADGAESRLHIHANDNPEKSAQFRHELNLNEEPTLRNLA